MYLKISPSKDEIQQQKLEYYDELAELKIVPERDQSKDPKKYIEKLKNDDLLKLHIASLHYTSSMDREGFPIPDSIKDEKLEDVKARLACLLCGRFFSDQRDLKLHLRNSPFPAAFGYGLPNGAEHFPVSPFLKSKFLIPLYGSPMTEEELANYGKIKNRRGWDENALQAKRQRLNKIRTEAHRKNMKSPAGLSENLVHDVDSVDIATLSNTSVNKSKVDTVKKWDELLENEQTAHHLKMNRDDEETESEDFGSEDSEPEKSQRRTPLDIELD